jgi:hypothetical protein
MVFTTGEGIMLRRELSLATNSRAIRLAIYDIGIVLGGILLTHDAPDLLVRLPGSGTH